MSQNKSPRVWLSSPHMGGDELNFVNEAFDSNWIAPLGPNVKGFEEDIESYLGNSSHCAVLSSGTAAIHMGLVLLGVKPGDEVLCQSLTFSASANPIAYIGAHPIFIDSEPYTFNMDPVLLEEAINDRLKLGIKPRAIIAVHLYGMPYKSNEIMEVAHRYQIPVLEDSAESLGSTYLGKKCGTLANISILSFNGNKIITTSGGGALVSRNKFDKEKAVFLSTQARDEAPHYEHSNIGYNYRMSNVLAGIGRGQMQVLDQRVKARRKNFEFYKSVFSEIDEISLTEEPEGFYSNRWLSTIITPSFEFREHLREVLWEDNVESRPIWKPMHLQPIFRHCPHYTNGVAEGFFNNGLCLPSGSNLTEGELDRVRHQINKALRR